MGKARGGGKPDKPDKPDHGNKEWREEVRERFDHLAARCDTIEGKLDQLLAVFSDPAALEALARQVVEQTGRLRESGLALAEVAAAEDPNKP